MRRSVTQNLYATKHPCGVSSEKQNVREETNYQKATFTGKETLSKLSKRVKEENIYQPDLSKNLHQTYFKISGEDSLSLTENVASRNANLRREIEAEKSFKNQSYFANGKPTVTERHSSTSTELKKFKQQVVDELRRLKHSEQSGDKEELLKMTAQLMEEVKLLEESVQNNKLRDMTQQETLVNEEQNSHETTSEKSESVEPLSQSADETVSTNLSHDFISDHVRLPPNLEQQTHKYLTNSCTKGNVSPTKASADEDQAVKMLDGQLSFHGGDCFQELRMTQQLLEETRDKVDKLTTANEVLTDMNIQWQDFNEHRDRYIKHLERQLSQAAEKTKYLGTDRPSEVEDLQLKLEVETQARARAEATVKHLTNRLNETVRQLEHEKKKVLGMEEVIQQITNSRNLENEDRERIKVLEEQIVICKEDFEGERSDRERLHQEKQDAQERLCIMEERLQFLRQQNVAYQRELEEVHNQLALYHLEARPSARRLGYQRSELGYGSSPCLYREYSASRGGIVLPQDVEVDRGVVDANRDVLVRGDCGYSRETMYKVDRTKAPDTKKKTELASI